MKKGWGGETYCLLMAFLKVLTFSILLTACGGGGGGGGGNGGGGNNPEGTPQVRSSVLSDTDNVYPTGRMVRIDVEAPSSASVKSGTIRITSASQGYDSGVQPLKFGSIFFQWDTTGLNPAPDYVVDVTLTNADNVTFVGGSLLITLAPNPPAISKLVSTTDISVPARGMPVSIVRTYLLDSTFNGPIGYGWTHSYRMRIIETNTNIIQGGVLVPVDGVVHLFNADGTGSYFYPNGDGTYRASIGDHRTLTKAANGSYLLKGKSGNTFAFNSFGELTSISDRNGNTQTLNYDNIGKLLTITDASGQVTAFTYNSDSRITTITDPDGKTVTYGYDGAGNLVSVTNNGGLTTTYAYDANRNLTTISDPMGKRTFFTADAEDRLTSIAGEGGENSMTFQYGVPAANQMTVTDGLGNQTVLTYDNNALVTRTVDPEGNITQMSYDSDFNMVSLIDPNGGQTTFTYDSRGNVMTTTDAQGNTTTLTYEAIFNQVTRLTDAKGNTTTFSYDADGNLTSTTYPNGFSEAFAYDGVGNLVSKRDRMGRTIGFAYDFKGRLTAKSFPNSTSHNFTYDSAGNLITVSSNNGSISFSYDSSDRVASVTYPGGEILSYTYDAAGNRTQAEYPDGTVLNYSYDAANRLTQISDAGNIIASYIYDGMSRITRRSLQNGAFATFNYDSSNRLIDIMNRKSTSEIISSFNYTYDNVGNRLTMTTLEGTTQYTYDAAYQLTRVVLQNGFTTNYSFDPAGNRVSVANNSGATNYTANNLNQYTTVGADSYTYDANGNMTSKTTASGTTTYTYDFENRLIQVDTPDETITYSYDPFGRRISKTTSAGATRYIYDGLRVIMEKDGSGIVQASYIHGIEIDEALVMKRNGQSYYYSQDGLGSVSNLTDSLGNVVESYSYDAYGKPSNSSSVGNPYLFNSREYEPELSLYYYRSRYFSPDLGRFISEDVIGVIGGINLYTYTKNDPVNYIDPIGFKGKSSFKQQPVGDLGDLIEFINWWIDILGDQYQSHQGNMAWWYYDNNLGYFDYTWVSSGDYELLNNCRKIGGKGCNYSWWDKDGKLWQGHKFDKNQPGDGSDTNDDGETDDRDDDDDGDGLKDPYDPDPKDPTNPSCIANPSLCADRDGDGIPDNQDPDPDDPNNTCQQTNTCSPDPTFIQVSKLTGKGLENSKALPADAPLYAKIRVPYEGAMVRANVPVFGQAYGTNFYSYRIETGKGENPNEWHTIATSTTPQDKQITSKDLDDSSEVTIHGNLATWDTGLKTYVYLPSHPKDHPIDLKGTYTIRLVVTGKEGKTAEDRVTVTVADVIPNAWGGAVISADKRLSLAVPEQAMRDSFRLISAQPIEKTPAMLPAEHTLIGAVYELREQGERFTKEVKLTMRFAEEDIKGHDLDSIGIYAYNEKQKTWEHLKSQRSDGQAQIETTIRKLSPYYAVMASKASGEGSTVETASNKEKEIQKVSAVKSNGHYLVNNTFEDSVGEWSNRDGDVGAEVSLDNTATFDKTHVLKITNTNAGGNFAVNILKTHFDAQEYPVVQFDYKIAPDVKTNFLVKVSGRWYEIGFTDDLKELKYKRVNIANIGKIEGVIADDKWHTARFNLYDMLRTKTGNHIVEEMIMADWDVAGYMKLIFGKNRKGASYYIDNFTISREAAAGLNISGETILIDNFNRKKEKNAIGMATTTFTDTAGRIAAGFIADDIAGKGNALSLSYNVSQAGSYAGYITYLKDLDLRSYHTLSFFVKGAEEGRNILVGLKDRTGRESKVLSGYYLPKKITTTWQKVEVPLAAFSNVMDWAKIENLSFSFENALHSNGAVLIDNIEFHKGMKSFKVDNFERTEGQNLLGGKHHTFVSGAAAINGHYTKGSPNGIYRLSYGGNIGDIKVYASELKSYAGWTTDLKGIDCARCGALSFRIRGAKGGENSSVYLDDGNFRWGIEVSKYAKVTTSWQRVTIPLNEFADYGVDLTHITELQFVFEGANMSGTIYLDDIQFGVDSHSMIKGVAYQPRMACNGSSVSAPTEAQIRDDLKLLRKEGFRSLVTYASSGALGSVPRFAREEGFDGMLIMGVWDPFSAEEMKQAAAQAPFVDGYCIGNEGLGKRYSPEDMAPIMEKLRRLTGRPVTTSEPVDSYFQGQYREWLQTNSDWLFPVAHPLWSNQRTVDGSIKWIVDRHGYLIANSRKQIIFKEIGFPTGGASGLDENTQAHFFQGFEETGLKFFYFEAFDQPCKENQTDELRVEAHWGLFRNDGTPKKIIQRLEVANKEP